LHGIPSLLFGSNSQYTFVGFYKGQPRPLAHNSRLVS